MNVVHIVESVPFVCQQVRVSINQQECPSVPLSLHRLQLDLDQIFPLPRSLREKQTVKLNVEKY